MPPLGFMGAGKRDQPPEPPRHDATAMYGTPPEREELKRLMFIKYLKVTHRIGRDDLAADPKEGRR